MINFLSCSESPSIVRGYLPPISNQLNSSERLIPIRAGGGVNGNTLDINFRTVTLLGNSPPVNNAGQITIHIGCKGKGLPRADIAWYELTQIGAGSTDLLTTERMVINDPERNDVNITEPAQGSNVLSVNLSPANTVCRRYICEATNLGGTALGGVDICPQCTYKLLLILQYCWKFSLRNKLCQIRYLLSLVKIIIFSPCVVSTWMR